MRRSHLFLSIFAIALAVAASGCSGKAIAPRATAVPPSNESLRVGIVVVEDEIVLSGRLFGPENEPLVILTHMRPNDQRAWFSFAEELAKEGYAALTFDFRGFGESGGSQDYSKLDDDLRAVVSYERDQGREQIFLIGASMGGTAALAVAADEDVDGVVAISPPSEFEGQDALAGIPNIRAPKLIIASAEDTAAKLSLDELVQAAMPPVDSETYSGNAHGTDLFDPLRSTHSAEAKERVTAFLNAHSDR
jgi:pimeloyl-ACP methyl ester carboxylesterase